MTRTLPIMICAIALAACATKGARSYNEAQKALAQKKYEQAIAGFAKAVKENPDFGEAYYNLGAARYHLAVKRLNALVDQKGSAALRKQLGHSAPRPRTQGVSAPSGAARPAAGAVPTLAQALATLPTADTAPILALLRQSFADKARAQEKFKAGKWVVVKKPHDRKRMLDQLAELARLRTFLYQTSGGDRGLLLLAIARPTFVPLPKTTAAKGATKNP